MPGRGLWCGQTWRRGCSRPPSWQSGLPWPSPGHQQEQAHRTSPSDRGVEALVPVAHCRRACPSSAVGGFVLQTHPIIPLLRKSSPRPWLGCGASGFSTHPEFCLRAVGSRGFAQRQCRHGLLWFEMPARRGLCCAPRCWGGWLLLLQTLGDHRASFQVPLTPLEMLSLPGFSPGCWEGQASCPP